MKRSNVSLAVGLLCVLLLGCIETKPYQESAPAEDAITMLVVNRADEEVELVVIQHGRPIAQVFPITPHMDESSNQFYTFYEVGNDASVFNIHARSPTGKWIAKAEVDSPGTYVVTIDQDMITVQPGPVARDLGACPSAPLEGCQE